MADYAVVVGISHYPQLSLDDLQAPDRDAQGIYDWLVDPDGGSVPRENVRFVRQADFGPPAPGDSVEPTEARVQSALNWVADQTRNTMGDRLYLYFSGHGFAPVLEEGAIFTAEADLDWPHHVYAYDWLRWFRQALEFREYVLWMDCCMNFQRTVPVNKVERRPVTGTGVPGPVFVGIAAQTKSALEYTMDDGNVHGVFSWTLLKGLRGAAANDRGRITGESLKSFLHGAMPEFLPDSAKAASAVDLYPFIRTDDGILFKKLSQRPTFNTALSFPAGAAGKELKIWTGRPHAAVVSETLASDRWAGTLVRGLYVAEVPGLGLRQGFQVSGAGDVRADITSGGPQVRPPDPAALYRIEVIAENPAAAILVTDYTLSPVLSDTGTLKELDMPGVYKIRVEFGRDINAVREQVVLLDRDMSNPATAAPRLASPAPIPGSAFSRDVHVGPFLDAARRQGTFKEPVAGNAAISVLARYRQADIVPAADTPEHPLAGLELLDGSGGTIATLVEGSSLEGAGSTDPQAVWEQEVPPGVYFLRANLAGGRLIDGTVIASPGWVTQLALQRSPAGPGDGTGPSPIDDAAIFIRPAGGESRPWKEDKVIEGARIGLAQGRNPLALGRGTELQRLLLQEYEDPVAGILGCHLLLRAADSSSGLRPEEAQLLDAAVARLRTTLGHGHPDVEALSLRCADASLRRVDPIAAPPVFEAGWKLLIEASYANPALVPIQLWQQVHAGACFGAYFAWSADQASMESHGRQLLQWLAGARRAAGGQLSDEARSAALVQLIPAAALEELWQDRPGILPVP
ncbi:caspase family protein [Arthrobacter sp. I2-34]|uniref:Caspase family protein n=1 Tax=Arthrobacter hankyongi TaxID=2904801 RepID=A0ABS9L1K5_9MICC|nr:caspase family protein [Arthrobacter hankyongi]MCG2620511.1 caspase family protein [Arthrobacter hankyongi]